MEHFSDDARSPETVCRDCAFAVYSGNSQTGCDAGRLFKFKQALVQIDECYDEDGKEFYVIRDRYCVFWRSQEWKEERKDPLMSVVEESKIKFECIVYIDDTHNMEDVEITVKSILLQDLLPKSIIFVNNNYRIQPVGLKRMCNRQGMFFSIEQINDNSLTRGICVDVAARRTNTKSHGYISIFDAGRKVPSEFFSKINGKIIEDLQQIIAIEGENGNGDVYQTKAYKMSGGNINHENETEDLFIEKIKRIAEKQECQHLVKTIAEVIQG